MSQPQSIKKNIVFNSIGTFVMFFCQWLMTVLVVRISGFSDSGILSLAMSCGSVFLIIAAFGIKTYQVSDVEYRYSDGVYMAAKLLCIALTVAIAIVWTLVSAYDTEEKGAIILYMIYQMIYSYADAVYGTWQRKWRLELAGMSMIMRSVGSLIFFCLVLWLLKSIVAAIASMIIVTLIVLLAFDLPRSSKIVSIKPDFSDKKALKLIKECLPFAIYTFLHTLVLTVPKLAVRGFFDKDSLGIFSSVLAPVTALQVIATFVINPLTTLFAMYLKNGDKKNLVKSLLKVCAMLAGFLVAGVLVCIFLGEWGLNLLYGGEIIPYAYLLIPMVFISILTALTITLGNLAVVLRDPVGSLISGGAGLAAAIFMCMVTMPAAGLMGGCYGFLAGLIVQDLVLVAALIIKLKKVPAKIA
ncbi:MAG: oligosaccharide flippase family protein [Parasporobacterium sp.]|nr:oligosaccharide flippase family protein [Parasporobacterium sp.]